MIIGIKYCGGCNPTYDRAAAVRQLKEDAAKLNVSFHYYREEDSYDACILVRGCNRNCVSDKNFTNCKKLYRAVCVEDFVEIKKELYASAEA